MDRAIALRNAAHLFPGLDADESIELWEAAYPRYGSTPVRFHHVRLLGQVARNRARRFGEPDDYFVRSSYFSLQKHYMLKNIFRSTLGLNSDAMHRLDALRSRLGRRA